MAGSPTCLTLIYILWQLTEHLSKPKVTMGLQSNKNGTCVTNLTCCMEHGEEDVIYTWKALGQAANESHNGSILPISWRWGESDMTFICVARNPVSRNFSSPILARKLCEGAADDPDSSMVLLCLLLVPLLLSLFVLGLFLWFLKRERQEENNPKGRSSKYGLLHCGNTEKDGKSPLTAHDARHTKAICL
ncbi:SLAM family member 7 isoform j precursor [Homo sapiens]|uniref:SLAM family member 7 isoform j precursor n=1 Tax=Homo sapiens TaxID=9606 RepID=UPI000387D459|nr:SLAM family member 7 isoform j [Homo sapiens]|eukprot:NP_001269525.1 SLAM family member 7 isoform j [Homo sapiens]